MVAAGLLAFFVHMLKEQVLGGQLLREEQRASAVRPSNHATVMRGDRASRSSQRAKRDNTLNARCVRSLGTDALGGVPGERFSRQRA